METLFRGKGLCTRVVQELQRIKSPKTVDDYISINCLRTWSDNEGAVEPRSVGISVHSKVILVDDRIAVVGSANLNDRSMSGRMDSEAGVFLWEEATMEGLLGGAPV